MTETDVSQVRISSRVPADIPKSKKLPAPSSLPTGSVIAIYGAERNDGKFTVEEFCTADLPLQSARPPLTSDR